MLFLIKIGAGDGTQTRDLMITNQLLYQLSYTGFCAIFQPQAKILQNRKGFFKRRCENLLFKLVK